MTGHAAPGFGIETVKVNVSHPRTVSKASRGLHSAVSFFVGAAASAAAAAGGGGGAGGDAAVTCSQVLCERMGQRARLKNTGSVTAEFFYSSNCKSVYDRLWT